MFCHSGCQDSWAAREESLIGPQMFVCVMGAEEERERKGVCVCALMCMRESAEFWSSGCCRVPRNLSLVYTGTKRPLPVHTRLAQEGQESLLLVSASLQETCPSEGAAPGVGTWFFGS